MIQSRVCRVACLLLAVGMGWAIGTTAQAQDPTAKVADDQDPQLQTHVDFLIQAVGSSNKIIRRSANQGLMAVGKFALPGLEAVAARNMGASSSLAARLAKTIRERAEKQAARATADSDKPKPKNRNRNKNKNPRQNRVRSGGARADATTTADEQDPKLQAHIGFLVKALGSPNKIIRRSANQGLMAVGKFALPALEAAATTQGEAGSSLAARLARTIRERAEKQAARATADSDKPKNKKPRPGRGGPDQAQVAAILEKAGLDGALAPEIKALMDQQRKAQNEFRARARTDGVDRAALQQERKAMTQTYRKKLQELLGPEGVKTFLKAMAERRNAAQAGDAKKKKERKNKNKNDLNTGPQKF